MSVAGAAKGKRPASGGASRWFDALYCSAAVLLSPYFVVRKLKGKKSAPFSARMARAGRSLPNTAVRTLWIHAVSVGEVNAAETLVRRLKVAFPGARVLISVTTVTGHAVATQKYGAENVVFYPHDFSWVVKRFLDRIRPDIAVLMELEVWPNMTAELSARGIPILVVNGRITARSAARYRRGWTLTGPAFLRVDRWLVQTQEYADRLLALGVSAERVELGGNIKYDAVDTAPPDPAAREKLRTELGIAPGAPVLIGGSTHPTEEAQLLKAVAEIRARDFPNLRLILVPRHPERLDAVEAEIVRAGFTCVRRSTPKTSRSAEAVILVDTMGELKKLYATADLAFVGGSLIPHGGQNVMEPAGMGVPVMHGPHMHNFAEAMGILKQCQGSVQVDGDLKEQISKLLLNPAEAKAMAERARAGFLSRQGATQRAVEQIEILMAV